MTPTQKSNMIVILTLLFAIISIILFSLGYIVLGFISFVVAMLSPQLYTYL
jgi:hypothetical protein